MSSIVDLQQAIDRKMRVALGRRKALMAQEFLDHAQIGAALQHVRGAHVPQRMGMQIRTPERQRAFTQVSSWGDSRRFISEGSFFASQRFAD